MKKLFLFMSVLLLVIGLSLPAQAVPVLQLGDVAFKLNGFTYFDAPVGLLQPGQATPGGPWTGSGRTWGVANITGIFDVIGGDLENPILSAVPKWSPSATELLQVRFGGVVLSHTSVSAPTFPWNAYFELDAPAYLNAAGDAYIEMYYKTADSYAADYAAGPGTGMYNTFGANIATLAPGESLWLDVKMEDGVLPFYDPIATLPGFGAGTLEVTTVNNILTGSTTTFGTVVGGTGVSGSVFFDPDVFPLTSAVWGTPADPWFPWGSDRADILMRSTLTAMYDVPNDNWFDPNNWTNTLNDPVTGRVVPEPATMLLLGSGLLGLAGFARKRRKK